MPGIAPDISILNAVQHPQILERAIDRDAGWEAAD
jgi:hypothetical protein